MPIALSLTTKSLWSLALRFLLFGSCSLVIAIRLLLLGYCSWLILLSPFCPKFLGLFLFALFLFGLLLFGLLLFGLSLLGPIALLFWRQFGRSASWCLSFSCLQLKAFGLLSIAPRASCLPGASLFWHLVGCSVACVVTDGSF